MSDKKYTADEYYIMSLKWSRDEDLISWWRPKNSGYTWILDQAGKYPRADVEGNASYYDNGHSTLAIPVEEVEAKSVRVVLQEEIRNLAKKPLKKIIDGGDRDCESCGQAESSTDLGYRVVTNKCSRHDDACICRDLQDDFECPDDDYTGCFGHPHFDQCPKAKACECYKI